MAVTSNYGKRLSFGMSDEVWEEVKRLSDERRVSIAEIVRQAVEAGLPTIRDRDPSVR